MLFYVRSSLFYEVLDSATMLCSIRCLNTPGQKVLEESLSVSREADLEDFSLGFEENRFTRVSTVEEGDLVVRHEATAKNSVGYSKITEVESSGVHTLEAEVIRYLFPSRYAPSDRFRILADELFGSIEGHLHQALAIEEWLNRNLSYQPGFTTEQSWALDTFETRLGVCRDFAHLGIAFCRALSIPARYVTVYAFQLIPQDFHAAFEVFVDGQWYLIDGTRLAPLNGMLRIAHGRDAADAAVATLYGSVIAQGVAVEVLLSADEDREFVPVTRETLLEKGEAIFLG